VLRKEYEDKLKEKDGLVAQERMNNALANLRGKLLGGSSKLDEDYAAVLVAKPELAKRLRFTSDGKVEVLPLSPLRRARTGSICWPTS
jgi:hypothetical protein